MLLTDAYQTLPSRPAKRRPLTNLRGGPLRSLTWSPKPRGWHWATHTPARSIPQRACNLSQGHSQTICLPHRFLEFSYLTRGKGIFLTSTLNPTLASQAHLEVLMDDGWESAPHPALASWSPGLLPQLPEKGHALLHPEVWLHPAPHRQAGRYPAGPPEGTPRLMPMANCKFSLSAESNHF